MKYYGNFVLSVIVLSTLSPVSVSATEVTSAFAVTPGMEAECVIEGDAFVFSWRPAIDVDGVFLERYSYNTADAEIVYKKLFDEDRPKSLKGITVKMSDTTSSYIYSLALTFRDSELGGDSVYMFFDFTDGAYVLPDGVATGTITLMNITDTSHYYFNLDDRYFGLVYAGGQDINELEIIYPAGDYNLQVFGDGRNPYDRFMQYTDEGYLEAGGDEFITLDSNLFIE